MVYGCPQSPTEGKVSRERTEVARQTYIQDLSLRESVYHSNVVPNELQSKSHRQSADSSANNDNMKVYRRDSVRVGDTVYPWGRERGWGMFLGDHGLSVQRGNVIFNCLNGFSCQMSPSVMPTTRKG